MANMAQPMRLEEITSRFGGELVGDGRTAVRRVASLESAGPEDIAFLSHSRYKRLLKSTRAAALILPYSERDASALPRIICDDPYLYFTQVSRLLCPVEPISPGIHRTAVVESDALVAESAQIGAGAYIGHRVRIGERTAIGPGCVIADGAAIGDDGRLHANVTVYSECSLGNGVIVHSGAVLGADGFGMALHEGQWLKIPQQGRVIIGNEVEIGANTAIDRGTLDDTIIEDGVKLDNLIQIGHNVRIGAHSALAGCVGIAGSARIGRHCTIGGGAIVLGHLEIADHVHISAATLITKSIKDAGKYTGAYPFAEHRQWAKTAAGLRRLESLSNRVQEIEAGRHKGKKQSFPAKAPKAATGSGRSGKGSRS
jgi:UDP-3-O-[3-hydroxymyristoyl] glucosamine N-acyltransferase